MDKHEKPLYSLIFLEDFKTLMGIDDREDKLSRFCLAAATHTIEQHCKRRLLRKKHFERIVFFGDLILPLREYPVYRVLSVYTLENKGLGVECGEILEPDFYRVMPDCGKSEDIPFSIELSPALRRYRGLTAVKVIYWAGYEQMTNEKREVKKWKNGGTFVPADLAAACVEMAAWNFNRYRGRRIGMTGNVRGNGKDGEHFELSMPENVRVLLEPYKRKTI